MEVSVSGDRVSFWKMKNSGDGYSNVFITMGKYSLPLNCLLNKNDKGYFIYTFPT